VREPLADARGSESASHVYRHLPSRDRDGVGRRIRFQADNDLSNLILRGLRRKEPTIDFLTAKDGGVIGRPDPEVLRMSAETGRIVVSHDCNTMNATSTGSLSAG
jgi:hypothetical protein